MSFRGVACMTAAALLAIPITAEAKKPRWFGCVRESSGCSHRFVGGDLPALQFVDRRRSRTPYRVCVTDSRGTLCWDLKTGKEDKPDHKTWYGRSEVGPD